MSDDNGDAASDDATAAMTGDAAALSADAESADASIDPSLVGRIDTIHRTLSTLGMRVDALVTSTTSYRSALTDRLTEYADLVSKLTRTQAADLEEYRRANERTVAELRRSVAGSEEVMERVGARIDSLLTDSESADDQSRRVLTEVRSILESQESLSRFLTESLDQFADRVMDRVAAGQTETLGQIETLRSALADPEADPAASLDRVLGPLRESVDRIEESLADRSHEHTVTERLGGLDEKLTALVDPSRDDAVADRLGALDERLTALADHDPSVALAGRFDTVHAALDLLATADQVAALAAEIRSHITEVAGADDSEALVDQLSRIERELTSSSQVASESWGEFAGLRAKVDSILETSADESGAVSTLLDEIREALLDVASGEVVGALWDEFRSARTSIELLVAQSENADADEPADEASEALRAEVAQLNAAVRDLLEQAEVVDDSEGERALDAMLTAVSADIAALRNELGEGLIVEPSDDLAASLVEVSTDVAALRATAETVSAEQTATIRAELQGEFGALRSELVGLLESLRPEPQPEGEPEPEAGLTEADIEGELQVLRSGVEGVDAELRTMRSGIEDIIARLDEGLVLSEELTPPAPASASPELVDQLAGFRDHVATELESLRTMLQTSTARTDDPERAASGTAGAPDYVSVDPDTIDLLRDEIRTAGSVPDDLLEALRKELIALRRRIKLRAEGELFSDQQLDAIAEAVARRLAD